MIIILNFGSQYVHLIARRIRQLGCVARILPFSASVNQIKALKPKGIILSGGPSSVYEKKAPLPKKEIFNLSVPILGICYGQQIIAKMLAGEVKKSAKREFGRQTFRALNQNILFAGLKQEELVWFSHGDLVTKLPRNFKAIGQSPNCKIAAMANFDNKIFGLQFHPEASQTEKGLKILENFVYKICAEKKDEQLSALEKTLLTEIKKQIGESAVLIGVSGGVDSFVAALLLKKAINKKLYCVFVDNGLMRKNETKEIKKVFEKMRFENFIIVKAKKEFLSALKGVINPEKKRKIIGYTFIKVFEKKAKELGGKAKINFLAQGTIYPDRIESAKTSQNVAKIKSHHNLTLPKKLNLKIIEPLKDLYKDEVRELGKQLGASKEIIKRHPFPGPGLAIRIIGEITEKRLKILRQADQIFISELKKSKQYNKIWQAFAVLLPVKTVGVMGDARTYENIISLRAVTSKDGMTADWAKIPNHILEKISSKIVNQVRGVNRVVYDISQKPPATIEYE